MSERIAARFKELQRKAVAQTSSASSLKSTENEESTLFEHSSPTSQTSHASADVEKPLPSVDKGKGKEVQELRLTPKGPPPVSVAAIVGGMSAQKQRRILDRGVDVLVATPGRLWDILQEVKPPLCVSFHLCVTQYVF